MSGQRAQRGPCVASILSIGVVAIGLGGCTFGTAPEFSDDVTVAPLRYRDSEAALRSSHRQGRSLNHPRTELPDLAEVANPLARARLDLKSRSPLADVGVRPARTLQ